jgi:hypothetical protein
MAQSGQACDGRSDSMLPASVGASTNNKFDINYFLLMNLFYWLNLIFQQEFTDVLACFA